MNRLLEFSASLTLFFLEASLFESLAEEATWIQGKCKRQLSLQIQLPVVTKTGNDLKPPKTIYNHLQPPQKIQQLPTAIYNHLKNLALIGPCCWDVSS